MNRKRAYSIYVGHIREAIEHAQRFVAGMSFEDFVEDKRTQYATVRALEIIGEATKRLPVEIRARDTTVPWNEMARMRDRIIHGYDSVRLPVVWDTVQRDLAPLISPLERLQRDLEREEDGAWKRNEDS